MAHLPLVDHFTAHPLADLRLRCRTGSHGYDAKGIVKRPSIRGSWAYIDPYGTPYCRACYLHRFGRKIIDRQPYHGRRWFTVGMAREWKIASLKEARTLLRRLAAKKGGMYWIPGGHYPELREVIREIRPDASSFQYPILQKVIVPSVDVNLISNVYEPLGAQPFNYTDDAGGVQFVLVQCAVCGMGGDSSPNPYARLAWYESVGFAHRVCFSWWMHDALEAHDLKRFECGHIVSVSDLESHDTAHDCEICGDAVQLRCNACPICTVVGRINDKFYCDLHAPAARNGTAYTKNKGVIAGKIDPCFDLRVALADFYVLSDLHDRLPALAENLYVSRTKEIATQFARYTIMATGGEARHWDARKGYDLVCVRHLQEGDIESGDTLYCQLCYLSKCKDKMHKGYWKRVIHYHGFGNEAAIPPECYGKPNMTSVRLALTKLVIDGKDVPVLSNHAIWSPFRLIPRKSTKVDGRSAYWARYMTAFRKYGLPVLDACVTMFTTGEWESAFGGKKWGVAAQLVRDYVAGKITPPVFIDALFGVQHNGGSLFNKVWLADNISQPPTLGSMLTAKRATGSIGVMLPFASKAVTALWRQCAIESGDPELLVGIAMLDKARGMRDTIGEGGLLAYHINAMHELGKVQPAIHNAWGTAAMRFRLYVADLPEIRRPKKPHITSSNAYAGLEELDALHEEEVLTS